MANKIETSSKNIKPRINLNHNTYTICTPEETTREKKWLKIAENLFVVISVQRYRTNRRTRCLLANALKLTMGSWFVCIPQVRDAQGRLLSMKEA